MSTLVSVVIPSYNHARYLRRAVESVLAQDYPDIEIVMVNDGSTDDTRSVAESVIADNPEATIRFVDQLRQGAPLARNAGVAASAGDYLLLLDVDDTIESSMITETAREMDADPKCGIVYTYTRHRVDPENPPKSRVGEEYVQEYPDYDFAQWVQRNPQLDSCSLIRREAFDAVGGLDPDQYAEDLDLWLGITKRGWRARLVPKPLFNYWHHGGQRESDESWMRPIELRWQLIHKHPELYDEAERLFVSSLMLASVAADVSDFAGTLSVSAESGFDWITVSSQAGLLRDKYVGLLGECDAVSDAKVSNALGDSVSQLLDSCRQVEGALLDLADVVDARKLDDIMGVVEQLDAMLPRIGDAMILVFNAGMPEIYGPSRDGTGRTH